MHTVKVEEVLFEPYEYIIQNPGKDIRTLLISAFNIWLKVPQDKVCVHTLHHFHSVRATELRMPHHYQCVLNCTCSITASACATAHVPPSLPVCRATSDRALRLGASVQQRRGVAGVRVSCQITNDVLSL
jgi:hypothetical protein